jgi:MraZ protein
MLSGEYNYNIDLKGRINFPAKLREDLGERFVLSKSLTDRCLNVYSLEEWDKLVAKVDALPIAKVRNIKRHLFSSALEVVPDKQGRILIPQNLRDYCGLEKEVVIVGVSQNCEIWSQENWNQVSASIEAENLAEIVDELGI